MHQRICLSRAVTAFFFALASLVSGLAPLSAQSQVLIPQAALPAVAGDEASAKRSALLQVARDSVAKDLMANLP